MVGPGEVDDELQPEVEEECREKYGEVVKSIIFEVRNYRGTLFLLQKGNQILPNQQVLPKKAFSDILPQWIVDRLIRLLSSQGMGLCAKPKCPTESVD